MVRKQFFKEIKKILFDLHNSDMWEQTCQEKKERERLNTYSSYLSAKTNEETLKTIKRYNWIMIVFSIINIVLFIVIVHNINNRMYLE